MKAGPFHASLLSTLLSLFSYLVFYLCFVKKTPLLLAKILSVRQKKKCDEKLHINGLFCQLIVLTLQCCCVPCASRQANQWLLTVTHLPPPFPIPPDKKTVPLFISVVWCQFWIWIVYFLTFLNYWRVLFLYIWCTFHWLKLWSLQIRGWNCGLQVEHFKKKGSKKEARIGFFQCWVRRSMKYSGRFGMKNK